MSTVPGMDEAMRNRLLQTGTYRRRPTPRSRSRGGRLFADYSAWNKE